MIGRKTKKTVSPGGWGADFSVDALAQNAGRPDLENHSLHRLAASAGAEAGRAASVGEHFRDSIAELPGRAAVASRIGERRQIIERAAADQIRNIKSKIRGLESGYATVAEGAGHDEQVERTARDRLAVHVEHAPASNPRATGYGYAALLCLLAVAEFPTIYASLRASLLDGWTVYLITGALSCIVALSAHVVGRNLAPLAARKSAEGDAGNPTDDEHRPWVRAVIAVTVIIAMLVLMVAMWKTRSSLFDGIIQNRAKEGLRTEGLNSGLLSTTLFALQILLFLLAATLSFNRATGDQARTNGRSSRREGRALKLQVRVARRRAAKSGKQRSKLSNELDHAGNSLEMVESAKSSLLAQENELLGTLLAEHDASYEAAKHSTKLSGDGSHNFATPNPADSEFHTVSVKV